MTEMESTEWWLALSEAILSRNRQVHSTTRKSPYVIVVKQLIPDRPRTPTSQRSTAVVIERYHYIKGLPITPILSNTVAESSIGLQLQATRLGNDTRESLNQEALASISPIPSQSVANSSPSLTWSCSGPTTDPGPFADNPPHAIFLAM